MKISLRAGGLDKPPLSYPLAKIGLLCILPDVQINLGVEIHEHDCRYKSEDDALTPVNVGHVHSVDPHFRHVEHRASHIRPIPVLKE